MIKYIEEIKQYIIENYKDITNTELARKCSEKFNLNFTEDSIANFKSRLYKRYGINLRNGINGGCFKKGQVPFNKGKSWNEFMSKESQANSKRTCFKKGSISSNNVPIGTERITKDGYTEIKVKDGHLNKNWKLKHRYIYEQKYGKIPKGYKLVFADGNRVNFDLNNLILVSNAEALIMSQHHLFNKNKELTETGTIIARVISKSNKVRKKNEQK